MLMDTYLNLLTAVFILVENSRDVPWKVPTRFWL